MAYPIVAEVSVAGVKWRAILAPLEGFRVTADDRPVAATWDRQTIYSRAVPIELTQALRAAIHEAERGQATLKR